MITGAIFNLRGVKVTIEVPEDLDRKSPTVRVRLDKPFHSWIDGNRLINTSAKAGLISNRIEQLLGTTLADHETDAIESATLEIVGIKE